MNSIEVDGREKWARDGTDIAKENIDQHDGYIEVERESIPGHGMTFSVWLPIQEEKDEQAVSENVERAMLTNNRR